MSAPITASDPAVRYRFWLTEGLETREFERRVPADVMMDLENLRRIEYRSCGARWRTRGSPVMFW